jgi:hypothetical protein
LFAIHEWNDNNGVVRRRMLCSRIHRTIPTDGSPSVIQVSIAALLGSKDAFFRYRSLPVGYSPGLKNHGQREKDKKGKVPANVGESRDVSMQDRRAPGGFSVRQIRHCIRQPRLLTYSSKLEWLIPCSRKKNISSTRWYAASLPFWLR